MYNWTVVMKLQKNEMNIIGQRLRELRNRHNLSQEKMADALGITPKHYANIECGRKGVTAELAIKIRREFSVPTDYILDGIIPNPDGIPLYDLYNELPKDKRIIADKLLQDMIKALTL